MRLLYILMVCLFVFFSGLPEVAQAQSDVFIIRKVKSYTDYCYSVENPSHTTWVVKIQTFLDTDGRITDEWLYHINADSSISIHKHHRDTTVQGTMFGEIYRIGSKPGNAEKSEEIKYHYDIHGNIQRTVIKYDELHNVIERSKFNPDSTKDSYEKFKYDVRGNILVQTDSNSFHVGGMLTAQKVTDAIYTYTFRYDKFDKAGNWVQQSYLIGGRFVLCTKREIEYY